MRLLTAAQFRQHLDDEEGMSLVEVLVAIFILSIALVALAGVAATSLAAVRISRDRDLATAAASGAIEAARAEPFHALALDDANVFTGDALVTSGQFAHDGTTFENLVVAPTGLQPYRCTSPAACWFDYSADATRHTVSTYVTWFDDPGAPGTLNAKRVTVVVTWSDRGTVREVRQSSILADARRGLGAPDYQISNMTQAIAVPKPASSSLPRVACFQHVLENFGATDSYDLWYGTTGGAVTPSSIGNYAVGLVYKNAGGTFKKWIARAWMGGTAGSESRAWLDGYYANGEVSPNETDPTRMKDVDGAAAGGDVNLEQNGSVAKDTQAPLVICYVPDGSQTPAPPETVKFEVRIRSAYEAQLDPTATGQVLSHEISVKDTNVGLHVKEATAASLGDLDLLTPPVRTLPDYDGDGIPGYGLLKPLNNLGIADKIDWADNQDVAGLTMKTNTLRVWTSWDNAAAFGDTTNRTITFTVRLCVDATSVSCLDGGTAAADASFTKGYTHNQAGWVSHDIPLSFGTAHTVDGGRFVRVRISCESGGSGSEEDCHLAYDTDVFRSRLIVSAT